MEQQWLDDIDSYITKEQGIQIMSETADLKNIQDTGDSDEALDSIPRLQISDLDKTLRTPHFQVIEDLFESGVTTLSHELPFTSGIAYVDFAMDISNLDFDDIVLLPLFCQLLLQGGTDAYDDVKMQQQIDRFSGGISITPFIEEIVESDDEGYYLVPDGKHFVTKLVISGSCIASDTCLPMMNLFRHFVWDSNVRNKAKAVEILEIMINDLDQDVQTNGHKYTTSRIESRYSLSGFVREQWYGVTQLMVMRRALGQIKDNFTDISMRLVKMQDAVKRGHRNGMLMSITGDQVALSDLKGPMPPKGHHSLTLGRYSIRGFLRARIDYKRNYQGRTLIRPLLCLLESTMLRRGVSFMKSVSAFRELIWS
jgi:Zn-dependent M16 (insulinase) family peptidase